jgi:hypothetical protein
MRPLSVCLSTLALAPVVLAQRVAEIEPNGTVAQAQVVAIGSQVDAQIDLNEQDWYQFTVASNTRVRIHTSSINSTLANHGDVRIALLDATGTTYLAIDDDGRGAASGWSSDLTLNVTAGTYTVQVVPFDGTVTGPYSFEVAEITPVVYTGTEVEPNNSHTTATPTTLPAGGVARYHGAIAAPTLQLTDTVPAVVNLASYTATAGTTTVLTAGPLVASQYVGGFAVSITSGPNIGLVRAISSNTTTTITTAAFPVANPAGTTFDVLTNTTTTITRATTTLTPALWTPTSAGFGRFSLRFTSGANAGLARQITANTAATITTAAFPVASSPADTFVVELVDADYYQVVLTGTTTGVWFQINEGDAPAVFGHRYEVFDSAGVPVTSTLGASGGNTGTTAGRTSQMRAWPAGTYYIAVRPLPSPLVPAATMPLGLVPTGNYVLEIVTMPMDVGGTVPEAAEPNNTVATATPIALGQIGQGNVTNTTGADSSDWWGPITIPSAGTVMVQTRQGAATAMTDTTINLRDANGAILLTATTGNVLSPSSHARLLVSFSLTPATGLTASLAPVTGYIEVVSPGTTAAQAGNYELQISSLGAAPYVMANYIPVAANATCGTAPFPTLANQYTSGTTLGISETPLLGTTFSREIRTAPASAIYVHMIGFSNTVSGATPLPFDMTPFGAPGCTLNIDPAILAIGTTDATGTAIVNTPLPGNVAFRGFVWYEQAIVNNPSANAFGAQFSNYTIAVAGERSY